METVRAAESAAPADWVLADAREDWADTVRWGPRGFAVYARVDFAPHGSTPGSTDDMALYGSVFGVLGSHTATPSQCWAAVWEGWCGEEPPKGPRGAAVPIPHREMLLYGAAADSLRNVPGIAWRQEHPSQVAPHLSWPDDHAWCVAIDVDDELAFTVACSEDAYAALAAALPDQVRRAHRGDPEPLYAPGGPATPIDPAGQGAPLPPALPGAARYAMPGLLGFGVFGPDLMDGG